MACALVAGDPAEFSDGFEAATLNSFWSIRQDAGSITFPSTTQVHSGQQSVQFNSVADAGQKTIELKHTFAAPQYGTASVWVFDSGADLTSGNYIRLYVANTERETSAALYTTDYDLGAADGGNYYFNVDGTSTSSSVDRTCAWHKWTIVVMPDATTLTVDGETVYHRPSGDAFNVVVIDLTGPGWRPALTTFFDDFTFAAAPTLGLRVSQVQLSWQSVTNVTYQVKYREAVAGAEWAPLGESILGSGSLLDVTDEVQPGQPRRFYRVDVTNTP